MLDFGFSFSVVWAFGLIGVCVGGDVGEWKVQKGCAGREEMRCGHPLVSIMQTMNVVSPDYNNNDW